jgi:hypothetical protein
MTEIRYTLLTDGPTDQVLLPILNWLLRDLLPETAIQPLWWDPQRFPQSTRRLPERIQQALLYSPCDLLFIHRDAEREPPENRLGEIQRSLQEIAHERPPVVCVIPVRMTEAWLLFEEAAIRRASGNPNGKVVIELPSLRRVEQLPDPKEVLYSLLREASGLTGRRLKDFRYTAAVYRIAEIIEDFSPLRVLSAFQALEQELRNIIDQEDW